MVPQGGGHTDTVYTIFNANQTLFEISSIFKDTELSGRAILIYHNGSQLTKGVDYNFSQISPGFTLTGTITLALNDTVTVREYATTDGNYVPETPSKLGLHPKFAPIKYLDSSYQTPAYVIRGHDGSITPAFGDFRDDFLLELELRIYNNIKATYSDSQFNLYNTVPGRFRTTDYSLLEWNSLLSQNFLNWIGSNNVDYSTNSMYDANNPWTWNYSGFADSVDASLLQGSWRAIYKYWYDTDTPNITPWEMLGLDVKPTWWNSRYGEAPYTGSNTTLWEDLEEGYVWNGSDSAAYYNSSFARPGMSGTLTSTRGFIPVDNSGSLLPPTDIGFIKTYGRSAGDNFGIGQHSPAETAWRRSSDFPYAQQVALALARPAEYFASQIDTSRFSINAITKQISNVDNLRLSPVNIAVNGDTTSIAGVTLRTRVLATIQLVNLICIFSISQYS
jgi:hypothetical protein